MSCSRSGWMPWTALPILLNGLIAKQNPARPRDLSASGCFQTFHPTSRENCIYTSGKWKSYIHLGTREEILACLALAALSMFPDCRGGRGPLWGGNPIAEADRLSSKKAKLGTLNYCFHFIDYISKYVP